MVAPVSVSIGGLSAEVLDAGTAPGLVTGVMQVNARVPDRAAVGVSVPVQVKVGAASRLDGVTLAVR